MQDAYCTWERPFSGNTSGRVTMAIQTNCCTTASRSLYMYVCMTHTEVNKWTTKKLYMLKCFLPVNAAPSFSMLKWTFAISHWSCDYIMNHHPKTKNEYKPTHLCNQVSPRSMGTWLSVKKICSHGGLEVAFGVRCPASAASSPTLDTPHPPPKKNSLISDSQTVFSETHSNSATLIHSFFFKKWRADNR